MANRNVTCRIKLFKPVVRQLSAAVVPALEKTAEALHTEVVQAQVMPFATGTMQGDRTSIEAGESITSAYENGQEVINAITKAHNGTVYITTAAPQVRRLYYHPEYQFSKEENPHAKGYWFDDWLPGGKEQNFAQETFNKFYAQEADI